MQPPGPPEAGGGCIVSYLDLDLNPPGCGALFLRRATAGACKKQTAAPAPPRLFLPQAAARLRSPPPYRCNPAAAPPPLDRGSEPITAPPGCRLRSSRTCPVDLVPVGLSLCRWDIFTHPPAHRGNPRPAAAPLDRGSGLFPSPLSTKPGGTFWWMYQKSPQRKTRSSSQRPRAPVWGRARRAGGTDKGWRAGIDKNK